MSDQLFSFEAEFALLDVGATSSMLRTGAVRPTVLIFKREGVESIALAWDDRQPVERAFEEARRFARDASAIAYALIVHFLRDHGRLTYLLPGETAPLAFEFLGIALFDEGGNARGVSYPVRRVGDRISFGMPAVTDAETTDWCPLGDIWGNPFCVGDTVRFRARERAVEPNTPLWNAIVELTRMRIHDDRANSEDYMGFLDDLRNGVFLVQGRPVGEPESALLRPRTTFNPLGTLTVEASRLTLADRVDADVETAGAPEQVAVS